MHADRAAQATPFWLRVYISLTILAAYWVSPPFTQLDGHGEALLIWGATLLGELFGHSWEASDREHFLERMWEKSTQQHEASEARARAREAEARAQLYKDALSKGELERIEQASPVTHSTHPSRRPPSHSGELELVLLGEQQHQLEERHRASIGSRPKPHTSHVIPLYRSATARPRRAHGCV